MIFDDTKHLKVERLDDKQCLKKFLTPDKHHISHITTHKNVRNKNTLCRKVLARKKRIVASIPPLNKPYTYINSLTSNQLTSKQKIN